MAAQSKLKKNLTDTLKLLARKLTYAQYHQVLVTIDSAMCGVEFGYDDTSIYKFFAVVVHPNGDISSPIHIKNLKIDSRSVEVF